MPGTERWLRGRENSKAAKHRNKQMRRRREQHYELARAIRERAERKERE